MKKLRCLYMSEKMLQQEEESGLDQWIADQKRKTQGRSGSVA
jgi:hypothetical protein